MDYINLGKTGLKVSRICLGCMTYGEPATGELKGGRHAWALNEEESQPFSAPGARSRHQLLRYRKCLLERRQRGSGRAIPESQRPPRSRRHCHQSAWRHAR